MVKFWKTFRYFALCAAALQTWGCGIINWQDLFQAGLTQTALEFLTDNNGIFDLFTDN